PSILFFYTLGLEQPHSRVSGFMDAAIFSAHLHDRHP
ncbi:hypothetical protein, partial [Salmonella enterica]